MTDTNSLDPSEQGVASNPTPVAPTLDYAALGRSHLEAAFKRILVMVPLPALSIFLWLCNMMTYMWDRGPQLCNVSHYCQELISLPTVLAPLTIIFIIAALFTLDHLLAVSPYFNNSKVYSRVEQREEEPRNFDDESTSNHRPPRPPLVLRTLSIASCALGVMGVITSLVAIANASLVIHNDFPDHGVNGKYTRRVGLGYGEAVFDALLAYLLFKIAILCSMARKAEGAGLQVVPVEDGPESRSLVVRLSGALQAIRSVSPRHLWSERTSPDKTVLLLLISFTLSLFSFIFYAILTSLAHFRLYEEAANYSSLCLLSFILTWLFLFKFHRYRCAGVCPGRTVRILTSSIACILGLYSLYTFGAFIAVSVRSLLCDVDAPERLPGQPSCIRVGRRAALDGVVAGLLAFILAWSLGGVAVMSWKAGTGIQLGGRDARDGPATGEVPV